MTSQQNWVALLGLFCVRNSMKLFQQLLVAPAALGLLAPVAQAADLNIAGVSDYAAQSRSPASPNFPTSTRLTGLTRL